jgi:membrane protease YdiL (CAAX protease family)
MEPKPKWLARHAVVAYFALTFAISWTAAALVALPSFLRHEPFSPITGIRMFPAMLLGPILASIVLTWQLEGGAALRALFGRMRRWRVGKWAFALLLPPVLVLGVLTALMHIVSPNFAPNRFWLGIAFGLPAGILEELGWSGFAFPHMRERMNALRASILLGLFWSLWHMPVINYLGTVTPHGRHWLLFFLAFGFAMTAMRVLISWLYTNTGSLLLAQAMHVSSTGALVVFSPPDVSAMEEIAWYGAYGLALWCVVAMIAKRMPAAQPHSNLRQA